MHAAPEEHAKSTARHNVGTIVPAFPPISKAPTPGHALRMDPGVRRDDEEVRG
jgi:hypothetical protein